MSFVSKIQSIAYGTAAMKYAEEKKINGKSVAFDFDRHALYGDDGNDMIKEMNSWAARNGHGNIKNKFFWISFSPSPEMLQKLDTPEKWKAAHDRYLQLMGLDNCQRLTIMHTGSDIDNDRAHLHDIVNRTDENGNLISDKFIGNKGIIACKILSEEYGVKSAVDIGKDRKKDIKAKCRAALASLPSYSFDAFKNECLKRGVILEEVTNEYTKEVQGFTAALSGHENIAYKISDIDRNLTLKRINATYEKLRQAELKKQQELKEKENGIQKTKQTRQQSAPGQQQRTERDPRLKGWGQLLDHNKPERSDEQSETRQWHWKR